MDKLISKSAQLSNTLQLYYSMYEDQVVISTGWGYSGMVLLDHARKIWPKVPVVSVDTGFLFSETIVFAHFISDLWSLDVKWYEPINSEHMPPTKECCIDRKVTPMARALAPYDAWITAIRRDQASTRKNAAEAETDRWGKMRLAPMLDWTSGHCREYIELNKVPIQPLHARGYRSIGCAPCTSLPNQDERSGRWEGVREECGIHTKD